MAQVMVCLRYDDWGMHPEALAYDQALVDIADRYECPITLSIVPQSKHLARHKDVLLDSRFYATLDKGALEVAMHGCKHARGIIEKLLHVHGEFGKKPQFLQRWQLKRALRHWKKYMDVPVHIFVPPYNVYDHHTATILAELGFDLISDGPLAHCAFGTDATSDTMDRLPFTCGIERVADLVEELDRHTEDTTYGLVALFHHYNYDIRLVEELVSTLSARDNVRFVSLEDMYNVVGADAITSLERQGAKYYQV